MAIGPVQLMVLGFNHPDFHGDVIAELERLRASDTVQVIDSIVVYKDADGELGSGSVTGSSARSICCDRDDVGRGGQGTARDGDSGRLCRRRPAVAT